ncbi:hypothetical protein [Pelagicoccus sp. SDUM812002]|uniref:hypothetical protein n=1 Tax=Pelagicoccus sp. SDUM812002 TaxID=3041266 RepID=UPI00280F3EA4|nr:hypothetical protein [Pelagicoccus sp. SDUM812002]MDQ8186129.1 hypothetical protein [Pelagicoccus sp. SDUM812002]
MNPLSQRIRRFVRTFMAICGLLALIGIFTSCTQVKVANPETNLELAPAPYFDNTTGIYFPGALGPLFRRPIIELEEKSPGLGLAISYRNSETRIDVFVYDLQASVIPSGNDSEVINKSFQDAIDDLHLAVSKRIYSQLDLADSQSRQIGRIEFKHARFTYTEGLAQKEGELYIAGVNSQILKIRTAKRIGSTMEIPRLLAYIVQSIEQSQFSGYGGISTEAYKRISQQLSQIRLDDGLSALEAISIAQIELVGNKLHNRYDATSGRILDSGTLPQSATVAFTPFPSNSSNRLPPVLISVRGTGRAEILDTRF